MSEYRRKTLRSFYCDEQLWKAYEALARERDTTIDQVLMEALEAQLHGGAPVAAPAAPAPAPALPQAPAAPAFSAGPRLTAGSAMTMQRLPSVGGPSAPPLPPARPAPAAPAAPAPGASGAMPRLFLHFDGRVYPVLKEEFVIGRGSQGTDLTIHDGNISRKHASVIFQGGAFYIQDLGSTNGVEFHGHRIDSRIIEEGDVFSICDHQLTFSYRG